MEVTVYPSGGLRFRWSVDGVETVREVPAVVTASAVGVWGVNPRYLSDALKAVAEGRRGARGTVTYTTGLRPIGVAGPGRTRAVVMPMRLD